MLKEKTKKCMDCKIKLIQSRSMRCNSCAKKGQLNPRFGMTTIHNEATRDKIRKNQTGKSNSYWKGDKVGYLGIHSYVNRHKPKPELCEECGSVPPYDLANISQKYKRDLDDWEYLCRRCHMLKDGRFAKFCLNPIFTRERILNGN